MKIFYNKNRFRELLMPMATLILFFALCFNANAQVTSVNRITSPAVVTHVGAFAPGIITGSDVTITDNGGSKCPNITYEWQSATDANFTQNLKTNLANTKDYNPGTVTQTTYFRRLTTVDCTEPERGATTKTPAIKITIN